MCQIYFLNASSVVVMIGFKINTHTPSILSLQPCFPCPKDKTNTKLTSCQKNFCCEVRKSAEFSSPMGWCPEEASALQSMQLHLSAFFKRGWRGSALELHTFHSVLERCNSETVMDILLNVLEPCGWWGLFYQTPAPVFEFSAWLREVFTHLLATLLFVQLLNTHSLEPYAPG